MYILFEEHQYESRLVENILKDIYVLQDVDKKVSVQYVGYFYNPHLKDCVFILPKVLLTEQETLVGVKQENGEPVTPEMILEPKGQKKNLNEEYRKFIYEFSVWIYRALSMFYKANPKSKAILYKHLPQAGRGRRSQAKTFLDIVLSLIRFNQENKNFVLFTIKNLHRGNNKINWTRTISHSQAFIQGNDVVYLNPVNKKRIVNYEEELFIIFYSILNYLNQAYGFRTPINIQYDLIVGKQFEQYMHGLGKTRLLQIKYKYFSDKALQLWDLCFAFFENSYRIAVNTNAQEYLLAKSFNVVFEAMIDELIGTPHSQIPKGLADQDDGKRVDHMYTYLGLTYSDDQRDEIYYIGDSKYYKSGHPLGRESVYKQYTYARNVIQWNIDLFVNGRKDAWNSESDFEDDKRRYKDIKLRDDAHDALTEGYNVIPNFFISAFVNEKREYNDGKNIKVHPFKRDGKPVRDENGEIMPQTYTSFQFEDRLFDRDTLILSHYDVNFLYVLYLYARNKQSEKLAWRTEVRDIFRDEIRRVLQDKFDFFAMQSKGNILAGEQFIKDHFKELQGKLYRPYSNKNLYTLALEKHDGVDAKDTDTYHLLSELFEIKSIKLGDNPQEELGRLVEQYQAAHPYSPVPENWLPTYHLERYLDDYFVVGLYHDQKHWDWITGKNDKGTLIYNVRLVPNRKGSMPQSRIRKMRPKFAILYEKGHEKENKYHVFRIHDYAVMSEERMRQALYPREPQGNYFIFRFDEEVSIGKINLAELINPTQLKFFDIERVKDGPIYLTGRDLMEYRK